MINLLKKFTAGLVQNNYAGTANMRFDIELFDKKSQQASISEFSHRKHSRIYQMQPSVKSMC